MPRISVVAAFNVTFDYGARTKMAAMMAAATTASPINFFFMKIPGVAAQCH